MSTYAFNKSVRLSVTFNEGSNYDPALVVVKTCSPTGVITTYTYATDAAVQKDTTGQYHIDILPAQTGTWYYRWEGTTNGVTAADETSFFVEPSQF